MKISGGKFRGRNITVSGDSRPVALKVRKSCFDILAEEVKGKKILDLFSGTGALSIEALSRGGNHATLIDSSSSSVAAIGKNISALRLEAQADVYQKDVFLAIGDLAFKREQFDIIFIDPPYYQGLLRKVLQAISGYDILANSGYIVGFCYVKDEYLSQTEPFSLIVDRKYGQTRVVIYAKAA